MGNNSSNKAKSQQFTAKQPQPTSSAFIENRYLKPMSPNAFPSSQKLISATSHKNNEKPMSPNRTSLSATDFKSPKKIISATDHQNNMKPKLLPMQIIQTQPLSLDDSDDDWEQIISSSKNTINDSIVENIETSIPDVQANKNINSTVKSTQADSTGNSIDELISIPKHNFTTNLQITLTTKPTLTTSLDHFSDKLMSVPKCKDPIHIQIQSTEKSTPYIRNSIDKFISTPESNLNHQVQDKSTLKSSLSEGIYYNGHDTQLSFIDELISPVLPSFQTPVQHLSTMEQTSRNSSCFKDMITIALLNNKTHVQGHSTSSMEVNKIPQPSLQNNVQQRYNVSPNEIISSKELISTPPSFSTNDQNYTAEQSTSNKNCITEFITNPLSNISNNVHEHNQSTLKCTSTPLADSFISKSITPNMENTHSVDHYRSHYKLTKTLSAVKIEKLPSGERIYKPFIPTVTPESVCLVPTCVSSDVKQDYLIPNCFRGSKICISFLKGGCIKGLDCTFIHSVEPYLWAYLSNKSWYRFADQRLLERSYCNPLEGRCRVEINQNNNSSMLDIYFNDDINNPFFAIIYKIHRFVVRSDKNDPPQWLWYCQLDGPEWVKYSKMTCNIANSCFETFYLNSEKEIVFSMNNSVYSLIFSSMMQINIDTKKSYKVRRRPMFLTAKDMNKRTNNTSIPSENINGPLVSGTSDVSSKSQKSDKSSKLQKRDHQKPFPNRDENLNSVNINRSFNSKKSSESSNLSLRPFRNFLPRHWQTTGEDKTNYLYRVSCSFKNWEFRRVVQAMRQTIPDVFIQSLHRIENRKLYEVFSLKRRQMMFELSEENLNQKLLFHGTPESSIEAICHQGFDFRLSGDRVGALYGKGVYFALKARYSHDYCVRNSNGCSKMFLARVLVGRYTVGLPSYKRPPPIDTNSLELYDSCVDNCNDPSIFVLFDSGQVYPEYLVEYCLR